MSASYFSSAPASADLYCDALVSASLKGTPLILNKFTSQATQANYAGNGNVVNFTGSNDNILLVNFNASTTVANGGVITTLVKSNKISASSFILCNLIDPTADANAGFSSASFVSVGNTNEATFQIINTKGANIDIQGCLLYVLVL